MRRLLIGLVVAATTAIVPVLASAGNQQIAEQIAQDLRNSGRLNDYKINVKYQEGSVYLTGHVASPEQMRAALMVVYRTPGVTRVFNEVTVAGDERVQVPERKAAEPRPQREVRDAEIASPPLQNPLRNSETTASASRPKLGLVQRLESALTGKSEPKPTSEDTAASAERVPSSFPPVPAERVSVEEAVPEPKPVTPQKARPMTGAPRVAMQQAAVQQGPIANGAPLPMYTAASAAGAAPVRYDQPHLPNYAWPSYASYPNYAAVTYPKQYSPTVWPYIGPFYPYPQVPMGWRKVSLEWSDGWWFLDFKDQPASAWQR